MRVQRQSGGLGLGISQFRNTNILFLNSASYCSYTLLALKVLAFGTPVAPWFPTNEDLGSLLMFRARKQEWDSE